MEDNHLSLETLARWLAGELEHRDVLLQVVPHLMASCPVCRDLGGEIQRLQDQIGHWNEAVAVVETRETPELAAYLERRPQEERLRLAAENERLHTWGLCQHFLRASREAVFQSPAQAVDWARLAIRLSEHLSEAYHRDWIRDLQARAYAQLANALRVLGELKGAEHAFFRAEELRRKGSGDPWLEAEVFGLKASLLLDQRRFDEAGRLIDHSLALFRAGADARGAGKALLKKSKLLYMQDDLNQAISFLQQSEPEIAQARDSRLSARARQNLLGYLTLAGRHQEAAELLPETQALLREAAEPLDRIKLRWAEASIAQGLGRPAEAEALYREVRSAFLSLEKSYDADLVSLDLAALLAEQGRTAELKPIAAEIVVAFGARGVDREALASLLLFQQACAVEGVTLEMIRRLAFELRKNQQELG